MLIHLGFLVALLDNLPYLISVQVSNEYIHVDFAEILTESTDRQTRQMIRYEPTEYVVGSNLDGIVFMALAPDLNQICGNFRLRPQGNMLIIDAAWGAWGAIVDGVINIGWEFPLEDHFLCVSYETEDYEGTYKKGSWLLEGF